MGRASRDKGRKGEAEVAALYRSHGFTVRGLEGVGDHLVVCGEHSGVVLHSETKRTETAKPWTWWEQASSEVPPGVLAVVNFRRSRSPWLALLLADEFAGVLGQLDAARAALEHARERIRELEHGVDGDVVRD